MKSIWDNAPSWANHLVCSELGTFWHWVSEWRTEGDVAPVRSLLAAKSEKGACSNGGPVHMGDGAQWILVASRPVTEDTSGVRVTVEDGNQRRTYLLTHAELECSKVDLCAAAASMGWASIKAFGQRPDFRTASKDSGV